MSIKIKKYTKDQMAKMVEEATERQEAAEAEAAAHFKAGVKLAEENEKLRGEIGTLTEKLDQMNGEAITRENEIANQKADADALRNKLADTEAALGRANSEMAVLRHDLTCEKESTVYLTSVCRWVSGHPWWNLWAWVKRKLKMA